MLLSVTIIATTAQADDFYTVRGDVYVNGDLAGAGFDVRLSFPSGDEEDLDGGPEFPGSSAGAGG